MCNLECKSQWTDNTKCFRAPNYTVINKLASNTQNLSNRFTNNTSSIRPVFFIKFITLICKNKTMITNIQKYGRIHWKNNQNSIILLPDTDLLCSVCGCCVFFWLLSSCTTALDLIDLTLETKVWFKGEKSELGMSKQH